MTTPQNMPVGEGYARQGKGAAWSDAIKELHHSETFWVATSHPSGRPHVVPVLAVVHDGALYFATGPRTQKARNLALNPAVTLTTHGDVFDIVVEGVARRVNEASVLVGVAEAYSDKYGWSPGVRDGTLHADGAPTAGPPPYHVYAVRPRRVFGFPTSGDRPPTRWIFRTR